MQENLSIDIAENRSKPENSNEELKAIRLDSIKIENAIAHENRRVRFFLICLLTVVSISWLLFTGFVVLAIGWKPCHFCLNDSVSIAFITSSLATVLGLWAVLSG